MKLSEAKHYLPFVQAAAEGKVIQYNTFQNGSGAWNDMTVSCGFDSAPTAYRIKPTPKLRPWKPEEVPVGAVFRFTGDPDGWRYLILCATSTNLIFCKGNKENQAIGFDYLCDPQNPAEYSLDNGKTWLPCGVMEE